MGNNDIYIISGIIFVGLIIVSIVIFNSNVIGSNDLLLEESKPLLGTEGVTCSMPTYTIPCKEGLICATSDGRVKFDHRKEQAKCVKIEDLN